MVQVRRRFGSRILSVGIVLIGLSVVVAVGGCGAGAAPTGSSTVAAATPSSEATAPAADAQLCAECGGLGAPPEVVGDAVQIEGAQLLKVSVKDGYYSPNTFTVKTGTPVTIEFIGSAKGCVAKPKFADLGKSVDITGVGRGTIDLGALPAGTYHFTCGMGANQGTITVE